VISAIEEAKIYARVLADERDLEGRNGDKRKAGMHRQAATLKPSFI
jgi:hypothetical protein